MFFFIKSKKLIRKHLQIFFFESLMLRNLILLTLKPISTASPYLTPHNTLRRHSSKPQTQLPPTLQIIEKSRKKRYRPLLSTNTITQFR